MIQCPQCLNYYNSHASKLHAEWHKNVHRKWDLVERLRWVPRNEEWAEVVPNFLLWKAAAEIERLRGLLKPRPINYDVNWSALAKDADEIARRK